MDRGLKMKHTLRIYLFSFGNRAAAAVYIYTILRDDVDEEVKLAVSRAHAG